MVGVPAGDFTMGSSRSDAHESAKPQHTHAMTKPYWIARTPVTWRQFHAFCRAMGRADPDAPRWGRHDDHPVVSITWDAAVKYCKWAGLRLPTEAEWEKAARGVDGRDYPWGNAAATADVVVSKEHPTYGGKTTAPVGRLPKNISPFGALDMAGNVWEWCADWYDKESYSRYALGETNPPATGTQRVIRGGSWDRPATDCRTFARARGDRDGFRDDVGFRPVKGVE
jgi:serine/threonine-protein kinase